MPRKKSDAQIELNHIADRVMNHAQWTQEARENLRQTAKEVCSVSTATQMSNTLKADLEKLKFVPPPSLGEDTTAFDSHMKHCASSMDALLATGKDQRAQCDQFAKRLVEQQERSGIFKGPKHADIAHAYFVEVII